MIGVAKRVLGGLFEGLAQLGDLDAELRAAREQVDVATDVPYGPHRVAHRLDVYCPAKGTRPLPVMLYIHGGAFIMCSKETHRALALLNAQRAGYLVFNINYRLAPRHPYPAAIADACAAYHWVLEHAHEYGGDASRCVVAGESAGGNLALGVAIASTYRRPERYARALYGAPQPAGVMPLMPLLQTSDASRRAGQPGVTRLTLAVMSRIERAYLGATRAAPAALLMADPVRVLEECGAPQRRFPQIFSGAGTADPCCADVRRLALACRRLGLPMQAAYVRNEGHAFHALHWRAAARRFWRRSVRFLRQVGSAPRRLAPALQDLRG
jgi:acetyl esterase